jgi:hypothetical protein
MEQLAIEELAVGEGALQAAASVEPDLGPVLEPAAEAEEDSEDVASVDEEALDPPPAD